MTRKLRAIVGPQELAGFAVNLASGLRDIGWEAFALDLEGHVFVYGDAVSSSPRWAVWAERTARWAAKSRWKKLLRTLQFHLVLRAVAFLAALLRTDVFIFPGVRSYLPFKWDVAIIRVLRKRSAFVFLGSDTRPAALAGVFMKEGSEPDPASAAAFSAKQVRVIRQAERWADLLICSPLSGHTLSRRFANWFHLGFPFAVGTPPPPLPPVQQLRFLHAPSNAGYKGSAEIRKTMSDLRSQGYVFEFQEISGRPNSEVLLAIADSHVIIDELYSDTGLGGLGTEAAALGRVVVVGGYAWHQIEALMADCVQFPSIRIAPGQLEDALRELLTHPEKIGPAAAAHHDFVWNHWRSEVVAAKFARWILEGVPPGESCDPSECRYLDGMGAPLERIRRFQRAFLDQTGLAATGLVHVETAREAAEFLTGSKSC